MSLEGQNVQFAGKLTRGAQCSHCGEKSKTLSIVPFYDNDNAPAKALLFLCSICILVTKQKALTGRIDIWFLGLDPRKLDKEE